MRELIVGNLEDAHEPGGPLFSVLAWRTGSRADLLIACALWLLGFCVGSWYITTFNRAGGIADFGQPEFGAAVALACGKGFVNPGYSATPALARFLGRESDALSCGELGSIGSGELNFTQRLYRYLMSAVALVWAVQGVSWSGLWPLFGALFATTIAAAYGLFRLGMGRPLAVGASLALVVSAVHLGRLPYLRDYAKAPFSLALLLVMARMAAAPVTRRRAIAYGMAFGAVLGIGLGFRNDLLINVPPFLAVVLLCLPGRLTANLRVKAAAIAAAAVLFVAVSAPIVRAYGGGSNTGHVAVLGLMTPFDRPLGIRGALYDWGYAYVDQFAADIITSYGYRVHGHEVEYLSREYDRTAIAYLLQIARHWPADILARVYGSVLKVLELPFTVGTYAYSIPYGATGERVAALYDWQIWLLFRYLSGHGLVITALALTIIAANSVRVAIALLVLLIYYTGYPAIQFDVRHFFHLEFIAWWALAHVLQQGASLGWSIIRNRAECLREAMHPSFWVVPLVRLAMFSVVAGTIVLGSLTTLRAYQTPHVRALLGEYLAAPRQRLDLDVTEEGGKVFITSPGMWEIARQEDLRSVRAEYVIAEFSPATCGAVQLPVTFRYWYEDKTSDFSREIILNLMRPGDPTFVFFPAYRDESWSSSEGSSRSRFEGIELPRGNGGCLASLNRMADIGRQRLLIDITFTPRWREATAFQTLTAFEQPNTADGPTFYTVPHNLVVTRPMFDGGVRSIPDEATDRARIVTMTSDGAWIARGRPDGPQSTLVRYAPRPVQRHAVFIAEGELRKGAVSFALLAGGQRRAAASVTAPGPFFVALEAPDAGNFAASVANDIVPWWPASRIGRRVGPLVEWIPGATLQTDFAVRRIGWSTP